LVKLFTDQANQWCTFFIACAIFIQDYWSNFHVSDYRPSDFKQKNSVRQVGALLDTQAADQLAEIAKTRGTSMSVEVRRMAREYLEREVPKFKTEQATA
jgi:hypothetical protein